MTSENTAEVEVGTSEQDIEEKIKFILGIYPILTHTMMQIAIGTGVPPRTWRPVLNKMVDSGTVVVDEVARLTPKGQHRSYTRLYLAGCPAVLASE